MSPRILKNFGLLVEVNKAWLPTTFASPIQPACALPAAALCLSCGSWATADRRRRVRHN